jgi:hypothetical protein
MGGRGGRFASRSLCRASVLNVGLGAAICAASGIWTPPVSFPILPIVSACSELSPRLLRRLGGRPMLVRLLSVPSIGLCSTNCGLVGEFCRDRRLSGKVRSVRVSRDLEALGDLAEVGFG